MPTSSRRIYSARDDEETKYIDGHSGIGSYCCQNALFFLKIKDDVELPKPIMSYNHNVVAGVMQRLVEMPSRAYQGDGQT